MFCLKLEYVSIFLFWQKIAHAYSCKEARKDSLLHSWVQSYPLSSSYLFWETDAATRKKAIARAISSYRGASGILLCTTSQQTFLGNYTVAALQHPKTPKAYYFDTYEYACYLPSELPCDFLFGDITHVPESPLWVKSSPIVEGNENCVLLNMDKARHFIWVADAKQFVEKQDLLIGIDPVYQQNRYDFFC